MQHTGLNDINPNILHTSINLLLHEFRRYFVDSADALRVLRSEGGCGGHCIAAMGCNDLLVGFEPAVRSALVAKLAEHVAAPDSRSARAVRAGYHQHALHRRGCW